MEAQRLRYKLPAFEGPLDLLLTLISKNKINIYDIRISELVDQYLEQMEAMRENLMDIESEFLTMASRLVYMKSVMLLPKYEEEAEELKKELTGQLIEYAVCRRAAKIFSAMYDFDSFVRETSPIDFDLTYARSHPKEDIAKAYVSAVGRGMRKLPPPESAFSGIVSRGTVSVNSRIIYVMRRLWNGKRLMYHELFEACGSKSELVATFLAALELIKGGRVRIDGAGDCASVYMIDSKEA